MGKEKSFQQMVLGPLAIHMQKKRSGHLPYTKITTKRTNDLNVRSKTIKSQEHIGLNLYDLRLGNNFLGVVHQFVIPKENFIDLYHLQCQDNISLSKFS